MIPERIVIKEFLLRKLKKLEAEGSDWLPLPKSAIQKEGREVGSSSAQDSVPDLVSSAPCERKHDSMDRITEALRDCRRCRLCDGRTNVVIGRGNPASDLMFIGEGPGAEEDRQGKAFVGAAGQLLDKMILAMGFTLDEVYIANIVKCRPPNNRNPLEDEMKTCLPFLERQIQVVSPKVICALGSIAAKALLGSELRISQLRGQFQEFRGVPLMPTYHPAFLLRNPEKKRQVWEDVQKICKLLGREPQKKKKG